MPWLICVVASASSWGADTLSPAARPALSEAERQAGWKLLFDGSTAAGWRGLGMEGFPHSRWEVRDGCLHCFGGPGRTNDLITERKYEDFELTFEWMIRKDLGNSGVKYRVEEKKGDGYIALQDHHDEVYFRNLKLRELVADGR